MHNKNNDGFTPEYLLAAQVFEAAENQGYVNKRAAKRKVAAKFMFHETKPIEIKESIRPSSPTKSCVLMRRTSANNSNKLSQQHPVYQLKEAEKTVVIEPERTIGKLAVGASQVEPLPQEMIDSTIEKIQTIHQTLIK